MFNAESIISNGGLLLIFLIVFAQTGLFFCFFVPGGALMFTAGVLMATGSFDHSIFSVIALLSLAAVLGNLTGYWFGRKAGPVLYQRKDTGFFRQQHLLAAERFYDKHGTLALTAGVFLPLIRTFSPIVSGMIRMNLRRFFLFTSLGAVAYVLSFIMAGYLIGSMPFLKPYLKYLVASIVLVVTVPIVVRIIREFRTKKTP